MAYTTVQGDMWDLIAFRVYGSTAYTGKLMMANTAYLDTYIFPGGIELETPELEETDVDADFLPPWRR